MDDFFFGFLWFAIKKYIWSIFTLLLALDNLENIHGSKYGGTKFAGWYEYSYYIVVYANTSEKNVLKDIHTQCYLGLLYQYIKK